MSTSTSQASLGHRDSAARTARARVAAGGPTMNKTDCDVIVLGGGAPGEHATGALAEGGLRVAIVERDTSAARSSWPWAS
jgi:ribulose 1,5-bisphosphate synthetase/thiazole synthase